MTAADQLDRPRLIGEVALVTVLLVAYDRVADLAAVRSGIAQRTARLLLRFEDQLHVAVERPLNHLVALHQRLGQANALYYDFAHVPVALAVLVGVLLLAPAGYCRARRALVAINLAALLVFLVLPVAPPRLLPGYVDVVARSGTWGAWEASSTLTAHANEYASLPSLHVAWAAWVLLTVRAATVRRRLRLLAAAHLVVTVVVVLVTGNHYVLDVVAGGALTALSWLAVSWLAVRAPPTVPVPPGGVLVVSASMGAGHDGVAYELARRWRAQGTPVTVVDFLRVLPCGVGRLIRRAYALQLRHAPGSYEWLPGSYEWLYGAIERRPLLDRVTGVIAGWARRRLRRQAVRGQYRMVVSTYPLAGRAIGQLRREGRLAIPVVTFLTDVDVHATWLDGGTDLYLAVYDGSAQAAAWRTGRPALATGPVLPPEHDRPVEPAERAAARLALGVPDAAGPVVVVASGSWGVGSVRRTALALRDGGALPVVLCGRNAALREALDLPGIRALGWTRDVRAVYAAADLVVHNAGGLSSLEAFAAGIPVVGHACLPGHGRRNAQAMADAGMAALALDGPDLARLVGELAGTASGSAMAERAQTLFAADPIEVLRDVAKVPLPAPPRRAPRRVAVVLAGLSLALPLTSFGISEAAVRGLAVARAPHDAQQQLFVAARLDEAALADQSTAALLVHRHVSAGLGPELADSHPADVRTLVEAGVEVLAAFPPGLPRRPQAALTAVLQARARVSGATGRPTPGAVALNGLGAWSLTTAYRAHLPLAVATPVRSSVCGLLHDREQVVVDVPGEQLPQTLDALVRQAEQRRLAVQPLSRLWAAS